MNCKCGGHDRGLALSVVIPVYHEPQNIRYLLREFDRVVRVRPVEILVVYDFAEDPTVPVVQELAEEFPYVYAIANRFGPGALNALKTGIALARAPLLIVTMGDRSDDLAQIDNIYGHGLAGFDLVAASRYMIGGRQLGGPLIKQMLSRLAGVSLHWLAGLPTHDPTNNFKLYSRRLLDRVTIESTAGFELALELTVKAHLMGMRITEVPTTWTYRNEGASRFRFFEWLPHYLRWYLLALRHGRWAHGQS